MDFFDRRHYLSLHGSLYDRFVHCQSKGKTPLYFSSIQSGRIGTLAPGRGLFPVDMNAGRQQLAAPV